MSRNKISQTMKMKIMVKKQKGLYQCEQCEREINNNTTTRRQNGSICGENICDLCDKKSRTNTNLINYEERTHEDNHCSAMRRLKPQVMKRDI